MDIDIDPLISFSKFFRSIVERISDELSDNTKIITFKDILYCCLYMNGNSSTYSLANIHMCMNDIINVTDTALKNKRDTFNYIYFKQISDTILNYTYEDDETSRLIGIDSTYVPLSIELKEYGFQPSIRKTYCIGLVSSL